MPPFDDLAALKRAQTDDERMAMSWVRETDGHGLLAVWLAIQRMSDNTCPHGELISRFAQLGMSHAVLMERATTKAN